MGKTLFITLFLALTGAWSSGLESKQVPPDLGSAEKKVLATVQRLRDLESTSPHPLFTRHLRSLEAIVLNTWGGTMLSYPGNPAATLETLGFIDTLYRAFQPGAPAVKWESYYQGGLPLVLAYVSFRDHTTQFYTVVLPKGWDPAKAMADLPAYPLFVELHGRENPNPLSIPVSYYGNLQNGLQGFEVATTYAMRDRAGYHLMPFDRGNAGYQDIGEKDVWEAVDDLKSAFKTDPDRNYLYGFSMGGLGTGHLALETPDRWAAVAVLSAGQDLAPWQAKNLSMVPIFLWAGEDDPTFPAKTKAADLLKKISGDLTAAGGEVKMETTPGIGHAYMPDPQKRSVEWLKLHTRKRPSRFEFTVDDDHHQGIWGVFIRRDPLAGGLGHISCEIQGQSVTVTTRGASGVRVILGDKGLNLSGLVTVNVDGKQVYLGFVGKKDVTVGNPPWMWW